VVHALHILQLPFFQVYVTVPTVLGLATPAYALKSFERVNISASGTPVVVSFVITSGALQTTQLDGSRNTTAGVYTVWASGHLPGDPVGGQQSNVASTQFTLP
jgi:hypothetical protein